MRKLVIVESPTKARTISVMLEKHGVEVVASMGHVRDIPDSGINIDLHTFKPKYAICADKREVVKRIKGLLAGCDELYLATDEDREGESISWHLLEVLKPSVPVKRMVFHEITPSAISRAFENTRSIDMGMVSAQESRRVLDRLVGYEVSPLLWRAIGDRHLSAGRVQTPALKLIVDREIARMSFEASFYNAVKAVFETHEGDRVEARLVSVNSKRIVSGKDDFDPDSGNPISPDLVLLDEKSTAGYEKEILSSSWRVAKLSKKRVVAQPPPPFITSTLQQEANSKLRFSPSKTMLVAQHLYEKGFITYMRTDSPSLSADGEQAIRKAVAQLFSSALLTPFARRFVSKDDNAQNAHEAIRPAILSGEIRSADLLPLDSDERRLYSLIFARSLACQMKESIREVSSVRISNDPSPDAFEFAASGSVVVQEGFRKVLGSEDDEDRKLAKMDEGDALKLLETSSSTQQTSPPRRWSEAALVKEMERLGIGRPSTYASTISSIISRNYAQKRSNALVPTFTGFAVAKFLSEHLARFFDYGFTSAMEKGLDDIENCRINEFDYLNGFYFGENGLKSSLGFEMGDRRSERRLLLPRLSEEFAVYVGKYGPYISYSGKSFSMPANAFPFMMTDDFVRRIIEDKSEKKGLSSLDPVARDGEGNDIFFNADGKYGPYFFTNEPKRSVSLPKGCKREDLTEEEIAKLFLVPLKLAVDAGGNSVMLKSGRYGYYISYLGRNVSVRNVCRALRMTADEALSLFGDVKI